MFGHRFFGARYFGSRFFGPNSTPALSIVATGFADADAFGTAVFTYNVTVSPTGFSDADAFGVPVVQAIKVHGGGGGGGTGGGAIKGQKYGDQVLIDENGVIFAIQVNSSVSKAVTTRAALYADSSNLPAAKITQSAMKTSVVTGANTYTLNTPFGVSSGTNVWPALHTDGNFAWFLASGSSRFNSDNFIDGPSDPFGASTVSANKAPIFALLLSSVTLNVLPTGFANSNAFGSPSIVVAAPSTQEIDPTGFFNRQEFGSQTVTAAAATIEPSGFSDDDVFGEPTITAAAFTISATGFADADAFGSQTITQITINHLIQPYQLEGIKQSPTGLDGTHHNAKTADSLFGSDYSLDGEQDGGTELSGTKQNEYDLEGIF